MHCLPLADDCGISEANVAAIMRCIDAGALRGTSLMACGAALESGAAMLGRRMAENPALRAGAHLNLLEGRCTAAPDSVPLLADEQGRFRFSLGSLCLKLQTLSGRGRSALVGQIALEWHAQITTIHSLLKAATGWEDVPLYIDGHQHVHAIPALRPALGDVLGAVRAVHVRVPEEPRYSCPAPPALAVVGSLRRELLAYWGRSLRAFLAARHVPAPAYFIGGFCSGSMTQERLAAGLAAVAARAANDAVVEIMTHPGPAGDQAGNLAKGQAGTDTFSRFYAAPEREEEARMLLSPRFHQTLAKYDPTWHHA